MNSPFHFDRDARSEPLLLRRSTALPLREHGVLPAHAPAERTLQLRAEREAAQLVALALADVEALALQARVVEAAQVLLHILDRLLVGGRDGRAARGGDVGCAVALDAHGAGVVGVVEGLLGVRRGDGEARGRDRGSEGRGDGVGREAGGGAA